MKHLDNLEAVMNRIKEIDLSTTLFPHELKEWHEIPDEEKLRRMQRICTVPLCGEDFTVCYFLYYRLKWMDAIKHRIPDKNAVVLEVGSGSSMNIPHALTMHDKDSKYITVNMNKKLTEGFKEKAAGLPITIEIIEDDARNIGSHLAPDSVDAIVFEHSANDVMQAILCENRGIDTTHSDWFEILPEMIKIICTEYVNQTLEQAVKDDFLALLRNCLTVLKPGGHLIFSHYMFQYDLDLGYNAELWQNILPTIRPWLKGLTTGKEVSAKAFDPQWWLFYQK
ncbi:MAG: class I SAM-dependent methyltransferase [Defluviitaleaceae bacterium]|nr:class I SAM-dependent methyltransferase [Defluviitaleaceae bacterium]